MTSIALPEESTILSSKENPSSSPKRKRFYFQYKSDGPSKETLAIYSSVKIPKSYPHFSSPEEVREFFKPYIPTMKDTEGRYRLSTLFFETRNSKNEIYPTYFTMKDKDHTARTPDFTGTQVYVSFKRIYLVYNHIPGYEYDLAMDVFGSWDHWMAICQCASFKDYIEKLREELTIKNKAKAIRQIFDLSKNDNPTGAAAARYLADEGYIPKKIGRVTKEEKIRQQKIAAGIRDSLHEDMERLGLEVVSGGK